MDSRSILSLDFYGSRTKGLRSKVYGPPSKTLILPSSFSKLNTKILSLISCTKIIPNIFYLPVAKLSIPLNRGLHPYTLPNRAFFHFPIFGSTSSDLKFTIFWPFQTAGEIYFSTQPELLILFFANRSTHSFFPSVFPSFFTMFCCSSLFLC